MSDQWYYLRDQQTCGPVPRRQLQQWFSDSQLPADTWVWTEHLSAWSRAASLGVFSFPNLPATVPPRRSASPPPPPSMGTSIVVTTGRNQQVRGAFSGPISVATTSVPPAPPMPPVVGMQTMPTAVPVAATWPTSQSADTGHAGTTLYSSPAGARQRSTDPQRTLLLAVIGVLLLFLGVACGWIANSLANRSRDDRQLASSPDSNTGASRPASSGSGVKSEQNATDQSSRKASAKANPSSADSKTSPADSTNANSIPAESASASSGNIASIPSPSTKPVPNPEAQPEATRSAERPQDLAIGESDSGVSREKADVPQDTRSFGVADSQSSGKDDAVSRAPISSERDSAREEPGIARNASDDNGSQSRMLYQELDVVRKPQFAILGEVKEQDLHYQIVSELRITPREGRDGSLAVEQTIYDTRLVMADELSKASFTESLAAMKGKRIRFNVSESGDVSDLVADTKERPKSVAVDLTGGRGFLVTSVMDADGWKEIAEWSFFMPAENGKREWTRRMMHDFAPLGSWYGDTRFRCGESQGGVMRIDFAHAMTFSPTAGGIGGLPFGVAKVAFKSEVADGAIEYDSYNKRVRKVQERFLVRGTLGAELFGETAGIEISESQLLTVKLYDKYPWSR